MVVNASRRIAPFMMDAGGGARGGPFLGEFPPQDLLAVLLSGGRGAVVTGDRGVVVTGGRGVVMTGGRGVVVTGGDWC